MWNLLIGANTITNCLAKPLFINGDAMLRLRQIEPNDEWGDPFLGADCAVRGQGGKLLAKFHKGHPVHLGDDVRYSRSKNSWHVADSVGTTFSMTVTSTNTLSIGGSFYVGNVHCAATLNCLTLDDCHTIAGASFQGSVSFKTGPLFSMMSAP